MLLVEKEPIMRLYREHLSGKLEWFMHHAHQINLGSFICVLTRKEFKFLFMSVLFTDVLEFQNVALRWRIIY
jgi:hypothetical protein